MPRTRPINAKQSALRGPKIHLPDNQKIPLSKRASHLAAEDARHLPPAWRVETVPQLLSQPKNANYYKESHGSALMRRHVWQYVFGGLLRSIFGIYSNSRYWNPEREKEVEEIMAADYLKTKAARTYGIYFFQATKKSTIAGKLWRNGQSTWYRGYPRRFWLLKNAIFCVRINRIDSPDKTSKGHVDMEFETHSRFEDGTRFGSIVLSVPWTQFLWLLKDNRVRRLSDNGRCYEIHNPRTRQSAEE